MTEKSIAPALQDIIDSIDRINKKVGDMPLEEFSSDIDRRQIVERNVEIISEASRRLPNDLKSRHPEIPWQKIAAIGNVLRHEYDTVSPQVVWNVGRYELEPLDRVCKAELLREKMQRSDDRSNDTGGRSR